jgi:hypothetical protein
VSIGSGCVYEIAWYDSSTSHGCRRIAGRRIIVVIVIVIVIVVVVVVVIVIVIVIVIVTVRLFGIRGHSVVAQALAPISFKSKVVITIRHNICTVGLRREIGGITVTDGPGSVIVVPDEYHLTPIVDVLAHTPSTHRPEDRQTRHNQHLA